MPKDRRLDRLHNIISAATKAFIATGYRHTRIQDVAKEAGVSPGTVYLYVQDKTALFDLVIRRAVGDPRGADFLLPYACSSGRPAVDRLWRSFQVIQPFDRFETATSQHLADGALGLEFRSLIHELLGWMERNRTALMLLERGGTDWPELGGVYQKRIQADGTAAIEGYLGARIQSGSMRPMPDVAVAASLVFETCKAFAASPNTPVLAPPAEATVVAVLESGFLISPERVIASDQPTLRT